MEPIKENGIWKCPLCNFQAMNKKVVEMHIKKEHKEEEDKKSKKHKAKPRFNSPEFLRFKDMKVVVVLKNGTIIEAKLVGETAYNLIFENATITGTVHKVIVKHLVVSKSSFSLLHDPPERIETI